MTRETWPQPRCGCHFAWRFSQGSSFLATLGWRSQSLWDCSRPNAIRSHQAALLSRIPTGFRLKAQGCEARATLGHRQETSPTATRLRPVRSRPRTWPLLRIRFLPFKFTLQPGLRGRRGGLTKAIRLRRACGYKCVECQSRVIIARLDFCSN